jgi:hypothetical protein
MKAAVGTVAAPRSRRPRSTEAKSRIIGVAAGSIITAHMVKSPAASAGDQPRMAPIAIAAMCPPAAGNRTAAAIGTPLPRRATSPV